MVMHGVSLSIGSSRKEGLAWISRINIRRINCLGSSVYA